jgi:NO-binding membrane sensor protein with MHYT domain
MIASSYDPTLVVMSVVIASLASYTALDLAGRVTAARGRRRIAWLASGSAAMGLGIWSMHFVGMLAFRMPSRPPASPSSSSARRTSPHTA